MPSSMSDDADIPKLLNINDLAARLGVSRRTVHHWLTIDRCPVAPIDGTKPRKWRSIDVEAYITGIADNA